MNRENEGTAKGDRKVWFPKQREDYKMDLIFKIFRVNWGKKAKINNDSR